MHLRHARDEDKDRLVSLPMKSLLSCVVAKIATTCFSTTAKTSWRPLAIVRSSF